MATVPRRREQDQVPHQRPAEAGEQCDCGRPAVLVYEPQDSTATPWCGIEDAGGAE